MRVRKLPAGVIEGRESERGERRSRAQRRAVAITTHFGLILELWALLEPLLELSGASRGHPRVIFESLGPPRDSNGPLLLHFRCSKGLLTKEC